MGNGSLKHHALEAARNVKDVFRFGPMFVSRHFDRLSGKDVSTVNLKGYGDIHLRKGNSDVAVIRQVFGGKEYEIRGPRSVVDRIQGRYEAILAEGGVPIIVDAGANIGAASVWFATRYPKAAVVSIEPDPENARILTLNTQGRANCTVLEAALGADSGYASLKGSDLGWAIQTERADSGVPIVTVEDAFKASGGDTPFIVKIDIEGFERDVFSANLGWLDDAYMVFIEPHDWMLPGELSSSGFQRAMAAHDFELFLLGENIAYVRV